MSYGINLRVFGDYACFTNPAMKVERVSYDFITPSAARGIIEAIYWKPEIRWIVDKIYVLNKIEFTNFRRNEVSKKISANSVKQAIKKKSKDPLYLDIKANRQQRASLVLKKVDYIISAHFIIKDKISSKSNPAKHYNMAIRRMKKGQTFNQPYLGTREFSCGFELISSEKIANYPSYYQDIDEHDYGWMLYDIDFENDMNPIFYRAHMKKGVVDVQNTRKVR